MLATVERLLGAGIEDPVLVGLVESVFDYKPKQWFGTARHMPQPSPWDGAPDQVLNHLLRLATKVRTANRLPSEVLAAVDSTSRQVEDILTRRRRR
jgi:hypothetical protein